MFKFLSRNLYEVEPDAFGLDISDESFKFTQLKIRGSSAKLTAFGFGDFPKGLIIDGHSLCRLLFARGAFFHPRFAAASDGGIRSQRSDQT